MVAHREFKQMRFQPTLSPGGCEAYYIWTVLAKAKSFKP